MGTWNVNRMLRKIPAPLFVEWGIFESLEPFGEERADLRTSSLMQTIVNLHRDQKRWPKPFPLEDFVLRIGDKLPPAPAKSQTPAQQFNILKAIALAYAKVKAKAK